MGAVDLDLTQEENILDFCRRVELFKEIKDSNEAMQYIANLLEISHFAPGDYIIKEGFRGERLKILYRGKAEALRTTNFGDSFRIANIDSKDHPHIGEGALLTDNERQTSIRALEECITYNLTRENFQKMCLEHPEWALPIMRNIALHLSDRLKKTTSNFLCIYQAYVDEITSKT